MNGPARLLLSIVGISAAFALGRFIAGTLQGRRLHIAKDIAEDDDEEVVLVTPATDTIEINGEPEEVYQTARALEYFNQFLFGVDEIQLINPTSARLVVAQNGVEYILDLELIAEQPGEFFGVRVEHNGLLYGTCLVRFERTGRAAVTQVTVQTRYKTVMPTEMMNDIKAVVSREVDTYLKHLKERCESSVVAPQESATQKHYAIAYGAPGPTGAVGAGDGVPTPPTSPVPGEPTPPGALPLVPVPGDMPYGVV